MKIGMMRSVLILIYIAVVLLVSGLAQARTSVAQVQAVRVGSQGHLVHVKGVFTSSCQKNPRAELLRQVESSEHLTAWIAIRVDESQMMCAQVLSGQYDLVIDLRTLKLPVARNLVVKFANSVSQDEFAFTTKMESALIGHEASAPVRIEGHLTEDFQLVDSSGNRFRLQGPIDFGSYVNEAVRVSGYPMNRAQLPSRIRIHQESDFEFADRQKEELLFATEVSLTPLQ